MTLKDELNLDVGVTYLIANLFSPERRFISDVPYLLKTARNCLSHLGSSKFTRYMGNGGALFLLWNNISDLFCEDRTIGLHILPKLTYDHIKLTPYLIIDVKLAAQFLSSTVSRILSQYGPPEASGTARFCMLVDTFFNRINIRVIHSHKFQRKPSLMLFASVDDARLSRLRNAFLQYFEDWLVPTRQRDGNVSKKEKKKCLYPSKHKKG